MDDERDESKFKFQLQLDVRWTEAALGAALAWRARFSVQGRWQLLLGAEGPAGVSGTQVLTVAAVYYPIT